MYNIYVCYNNNNNKKYTEMLLMAMAMNTNFALKKMLCRVVCLLCVVNSFGLEILKNACFVYTKNHLKPETRTVFLLNSLN